MRYVVLLSFLFLSACQGLANLGDIFSETGIGVYHSVQKGQTLYSIAQAYGKSPEYLARLNGISDPKRLQVGTRLWIPDVYRVVDVPVPDESESEPESAEVQSPASGEKRGSETPSAGEAKKFAFIWPLKGVLTSGFGIRNGRNHEGIDIGADKGTRIVSVAKGRVVFSGWGPTGYGRMVIVKHESKLTTLYAHNNTNLVKEGDLVVQGQGIALVGSTGRSTGPHLHFEVREKTRPKNPLHYLPAKK
jgi:lipoprotein NlpD